MQCVHEISGINNLSTKMVDFLANSILLYLYCFSLTLEKRLLWKLFYQNFCSFCHLFKHFSISERFSYHRFASRLAVLDWTFWVLFFINNHDEAQSELFFWPLSVLKIIYQGHAIKNSYPRNETKNKMKYITSQV